MIRPVVVLLCLGPASLFAQTNPFPDTFSVSVYGTEAVGTAKPNGFTGDQIHGTLNTLCPGGALTDFRIETLDDGYLVFGADCSAGFTVGPGSVSATRMDNGAISLELP